MSPRNGDVPPLVGAGDRFRVRQAFSANVGIVAPAPAHTQSIQADLPAGTIVVARKMAPEATAFVADAAEYDALEKVLIPDELRRSGKYHSYYFVFRLSDIGTLIERVE